MNEVLIIAEAGVNHNGDIATAKKLIDAAADAKVDFVKFQTFKADTIVSPEAKKASYQKANMNDEGDSQYQMLKKLELSDKDHQELMAYCNSKGVKFFSTAFDVDGLEYLNSLNFSCFKVPSGEITNYPYLVKVASFRKPVILSTGMANITEVKDAVKVLTSHGVNLIDITILHCNTEYPTPMEHVNLMAMHHIANELSVKIGYSDHTLGIEVPIAAVALGATVIEKHFTLDRNLPGPDHKASLEPEELAHMVRSIRNIQKAISGSGKKETSPSEAKNKSIARKSIHLNKAVKRGEKLNEEDLIPLRPGHGISPMEWQNVVGKKVLKDLDKLSLLLPQDLED